MAATSPPAMGKSIGFMTFIGTSSFIFPHLQLHKFNLDAPQPNVGNLSDGVTVAKVLNMM